MPQVNLKTLAHLNVRSSDDIKQPKHSSKCGAYALVGALGAFQLDLDKGRLSYENRGPQDVNRKGNLEDGATNFHRRCNVVYGVTGILNSELSDPPVWPELKQKKDESLGNSLAAMAKVTFDVHMQVDLNAQSAAVDFLKQYYPREAERCKEVLDHHPASSYDLHAPDYSSPDDGSVNILLVQRTNGNMHWLAQGDDGRFYDPVDGSTEHRWQPRKFKEDIAGSDYVFLGIWMRITRPQ